MILIPVFAVSVVDYPWIECVNYGHSEHNSKPKHNSFQLLIIEGNYIAQKRLPRCGCNPHCDK